jgi:outer membrane protein assembly factor BamB
MAQRHPPIRTIATDLIPVAAVLVLLAGGHRPARAFVDFQLAHLSKVCHDADQIAVLKVEKVDREKKAIVYSKVRDLKGTFLGPTRSAMVRGRFTIVLREVRHSNFSPADNADQEELLHAVLDRSAEGKLAVIFEKDIGLALGCVGDGWYGVLPTNQSLAQPGGCETRYARVFCGDVEELIAAVTDIVAGKVVTVPHMVGSNRMLHDRTAPIRRRPSDKADPSDGLRDYLSPFGDQAAWSTHRGNPQRTGADGGPGPKEPKVLWVHRSENHFIAPLVPGAKDLYASSLGAFNTPALHALALDPAGDRQVRWSKGVPLLRQPIAAAPALARPHPEVPVLVFGDGFHTDEDGSLRCVRATDGFPLWQLPVAGKLVHVQGTPTCADVGGPGAAARRLFVGGGGAGVLCVEPGRVLFEDQEHDIQHIQGVLERRWKELLAKYETERKKDPQFTLAPDESMLPRPTPKRVWQQGQDRWHVDAPVALVEDCVLAASAYLDDEGTGERALVCLKAGDGALVWKTPLRLNPWAGVTVGPFALVGCSSIRLDPRAVPGARGEVVAVEVDTGKVCWRQEVPGGVLASVAVKSGLAIFTATDGKVRAVDVFTGRERWSYDAGAPFFAGPAVSPDTVYVADLRGVVRALNLADGKKQWTLDLRTDPATKASGMVYGSPVVHGGRLYVTTGSPADEAAPGRNVVVCIGDK